MRLLSPVSGVSLFGSITALVVLGGVGLVIANRNHQSSTPPTTLTVKTAATTSPEPQSTASPSPKPIPTAIASVTPSPTMDTSNTASITVNGKNLNPNNNASGDVQEGNTHVSWDTNNGTVSQSITASPSNSSTSTTVHSSSTNYSSSSTTTQNNTVIKNSQSGSSAVTINVSN